MNHIRSTSAPVPFLDLATPHRELQPELMAVCRRALVEAAFIGGPMVEEFERAFARYCGTRYCVGVNSGTDALRFALVAAGVGSGDAVITVPNTFIATAEAISQTGATPVFVDIDEKTGNMDPGKLGEFLEQQCEFHQKTAKLVTLAQKLRVAAIVPVHLYGNPVDMDPVLELGRLYGLEVIEDACQAHGASYFSRNQQRWLKAGSMGRAAAFSFYPGKNLGACGDAGAVTTDDEFVAERIRMLRDHGQARKYEHSLIGYNGRLDAIQAGLLSVKLPRLDEWNRARREAAALYSRLFAASSAPVAVPTQLSNFQSVFHLYVIQAGDRAILQHDLEAAGVGTGIHYPVPVHLQAAYRDLGHKRGDYPCAEKAAERVLSLPMFPTLSESQQQRVVDAVCQSTQRAAVAAGAHDALRAA
ncbi:MAG: DegT/DnrJ/EryC1/StrS family aminotransferase [Acidobacteria bacterium]|nr:DegT/DnrJ/EryC1/StrS family aminotransferase [Acidobacteriota bacterium]